MTFPYCSPDEKKMIAEQYRTGQYSYQQLAEKYNLSKSTIINIVKNYPYNSYKPVNVRMQEESASRLSEALDREEISAQKAYQRGNFRAYGLHTQRWLDLVDTMEGTFLYETLKIKRLSFEQRAWAAFAEREYELFGYCAETWGILTDIISDGLKDPWGIIPIKENARNHSRHVRYSAFTQGPPSLPPARVD